MVNWALWYFSYYHFFYELKNLPRKTEIQLVPTLYHQAEAIIGLLDRYEWYKYSIIVTDFSGSNEIINAAKEFQTSNFLNKTYINENI